MTTKNNDSKLCEAVSATTVCISSPLCVPVITIPEKLCQIQKLGDKLARDSKQLLVWV